ncbi:MAG: hypothetical protein MST10_06315 [Lentisphaeria bacterium]|nr:hypothetical protein [Lentisphaeria bacterium]
MLEEVLNKVADPGAEFRGAPFWAWNGKLEAQELRRQIRLMKDMGIGGFFMHARVGLNTPYLQKEWFDCVKNCIDEAKKLNMRAYLYDEDRWPSGAAGGIVTKNHAYRMKALLVKQDSDNDNELEPQLIAAFAVRRDRKSYRRLTSEAAEIHPDEERIRFVRAVSIDNSWFNDQAYLDTMNEAAVKEFIRVTHESYKREVGEFFGSAVPAIFTDEPCYAHYHMPAGCGTPMPWTDDLPEHFQKMYNYDIVEKLPEIAFDIDGADFSTARLHYFNILTERFVKAFGKQIGDWCGENNIKFTGHVVSEDNLPDQTRHVGAAMRFYEYMQMPGIDLLTEHWNIFNTAKQCSSMAHQFGKPVRLTETYGCTGWDFPFVGHKALGDWQAALGINFRCLHLAYYTMAAEAKRDYPASISYQSPWFDRYSAVENYFARLNALLSEGEEQRNLLVIHPIETTWGETNLERLTWRDLAWQTKTNEAFTELTNHLLSSHLDFDFGDEEVMSRHGALDGATLLLGQAKYQIVLLPEMRTIRRSTLNLLAEFAGRGGRVFYLGDVPSRVDAYESAAAMAVYAKFTPVNRTDYCEKISEVGRQISLRDNCNKELPSLFYQMRRSADCATIFVCNIGMVPMAAEMQAPMVRERLISCDEVNVQLPGCAGEKVFELSLMDGTIRPLTSEFKDGHFLFKSSFAPIQSRCFMVTAKNPANAPELPWVRPGKKCSKALSDAPWQVEYSEDNVLVLDHAKCIVNGEVFAGNEIFDRLDDALRDKLGERPRGGAMVQPWLRAGAAAPEAQLDLELVIPFNIEVMPRRDCFLAIERPELYVIVLNGRELDTGRDYSYWCDKSLRRILLPLDWLKPGSNSITLKCKFHALHPGLEMVYLLGEFGVRNDALVALPRELKIGDWCGQDLPYYAGNLTYIRELDASEISPAGCLRIPNWRGVSLLVSLNGQSPTMLWAPPYEIDLKKYVKPGKNRLAITVIGHRRNSHGPFYLENKWPDWTGPGQFKMYELDHKQLVPCGLLQMVEF